MTDLKHLLTAVVLASWALTKIRFLEGFFTIAFSMMCAGYLLALIFLTPKAHIQTGNDRLAFGLGVKFLFCGLPTLAAIVSIVDMVNRIRFSNACSYLDCFSLNALLGSHVPFFVFDLALFSWRFYEIIMMAVVLVHVIRMGQKVS
jgi:hypothetical protein